VALEVVASPESGLDETSLLELAAGAQTASPHPFSAAILNAAQRQGVRPDNIRNPSLFAGLGVTALSSTGDRLIVGSRAFLLQEKVSVAIADARAMELEAEGCSVLLIALGGRAVGLIALKDDV